MAPFSSAHTITLGVPLQTAYERLSSQAAFEKAVKLSPLTTSFDILGVEHPSLSDAYIDQLLEDSKNKSARTSTGIYPEKVAESSKADNADANGEQKAIRYRFKLVEKIVMAGGLYKSEVVVLGSQIVIPGRNLHLYETSANGGMVETLKVRRFEAEGTSTRVAEQIRGEVSWLLRKYTESECRKAHQSQMNEYHTLMDAKPM